MQCSLNSWASLAALAGAPQPRLFDETERLFGAPEPAVRLWHDSAAWHPFANQVWLLLEAMRVPYVRMQVPLKAYRKEKDAALLRAFEEALPGQRPDAVPFVQVASHGRTKGKTAGWEPPLAESTAVDLLAALSALFPERALLPRTPLRQAYVGALLRHYAELQAALYALLGGRPSAAAQARYAAAMDDFDGAYASGRTARFALGTRAFPDDGDGDSGQLGGPVSAGAFLLGAQPCAVDVLLLPLLERCEANVPHPAVAGLPKLALARWPALAALLAAGRDPQGHSRVAPLLSDATTTVGIRLAVTSTETALPPPPDARHAAADAASSSADDRADAAARLCANGPYVAKFAASGSGTGRPRRFAAARQANSSAEVVAAVDAALRGTAALLLLPDQQAGSSKAFLAEAQNVAGQLAAAHGRGPLRSVAEALVFMAENTGVPRDMDAAAARAFRAHLRLMSAVVQVAG